MKKITFLAALLFSTLAYAKNSTCYIVTSSDKDPNTYVNQIAIISIEKAGNENMKFAVVAPDRNSVLQLSYADIVKRADENNFKDLDGRTLIALQTVKGDQVGISISTIDASKTYKDMDFGTFVLAHIGYNWKRNASVMSGDKHVNVTCMWK